MSKKIVNQIDSNVLSEIVCFIEQSPGLIIRSNTCDEIKITQKVDGKDLPLVVSQIEEVLSRSDSEGNTFLQVNFISGKKILITENLIGFKPVGGSGVGLEKLPKVVTTRDLISIFEVIEESMYECEDDSCEVEALKKVFNSVLAGAEDVGFDLSNEKKWLMCLGQNRWLANA